MVWSVERGYEEPLTLREWLTTKWLGLRLSYYILEHNIHFARTHRSHCANDFHKIFPHKEIRTIHVGQPDEETMECHYFECCYCRRLYFNSEKDLRDFLRMRQARFGDNKRLIEAMVCGKGKMKARGTKVWQDGDK